MAGGVHLTSPVNFNSALVISLTSYLPSALEKGNMKLFTSLYQNLTCCREQYQAAKSSRWEHKGFLHRHNHLDSTSVYSRSIS